MNTAELYKTDFQTPPVVSKYMVSLLPASTRTVLEPTPGVGNIVRELSRSGFDVTAPSDYFNLPKSKYDAVLIDPPFSSKYAFNVPEEINKAGMRLGYHILNDCLQLSDCVIALMPWFTISDSDVLLRALHSWGLKSITALPRKTFQFARIQTCVFELIKGWREPTEFKVFDHLHKNQSDLFIP